MMTNKNLKTEVNLEGELSIMNKIGGLQQHDQSQGRGGAVNVGCNNNIIVILKQTFTGEYNNIDGEFFDEGELYQTDRFKACMKRIGKYFDTNFDYVRNIRFVVINLNNTVLDVPEDCKDVATKT